MSKTKKNPKITFALFAYNQERLISEAIEGAFSQTYSPLQIIISDDNSQDNTFSIINKMCDEYEGVHEIVINQNAKNLGIAGHVNKVFNLANGELIVMAAGDDISLPHRVKTLVSDWNQADQIPLALQSASMIIDTNGKLISEYNFRFSHEGLTHKKPTFCDCIQVKSFGALAAYHRKIFEFFGPLTIAVVEDNTLIRRACLLGTEYYSKKALVKIREGETMSRVSNRRSYLKVSSKRHESSYKQFLFDIEVFQKKSKNKRNTKELDKATKQINKEIQKMKTINHLASANFSGRLSAWKNSRRFLSFGLWILWFEFVLPKPLDKIYLNLMSMFNPSYKLLYIPIGSFKR